MEFAGNIKDDDVEVVVSGLFPRIARLRAEYHEYISTPDMLLARLKNSNARADIFTFLQPISDSVPKHSYHLKWDKVAALKIDTYEKWWKRQINDKTRNMVRKAEKKGVTVRITEFDDELVSGIHTIYNECPVIQGKPSRHYGKDFDTLKKAHATFSDQSVFIGAYYLETLIGFIKLIFHRHGDSASIMQIMSMVAHRDKAPANAMLARAIEVCAGRSIRYLQYGIWSRRGLGEFKKHHGFELFEIPRYFVPLSFSGRIALSLELHRNPTDILPATMIDFYTGLRARWYAFKYRSQA